MVHLSMETAKGNYFIVIGVLLILGLPVGFPAQSSGDDYLPLSETDFGKPLRMKAGGTVRLDQVSVKMLSVGPSGARLKTTPSKHMILMGKDAGGKVWNVELGGYWLMVLNLYEADLDQNGFRDLVLWIPTGGNGLAPKSHILTLTFDSQGRPVPFEADGYFLPAHHGIAEMVDMDKDGRAELVYMNYDDGYWITNIYKVTDARWERIRGKFGRHNYPLFTRFTFKPNKRPTIPRRGRHPFDPDLSNTSPVAQGKLLSYKWADVRQSEDIRLTIADQGSQRLSCKPVSWYASFSVVIDNEAGRRVAFLSGSEGSMKTLLGEIVAKRYGVELYGQRRSRFCSPEILWAQQ